MARYLYSELSGLIDAITRCTPDMGNRHKLTIANLIKQHLPSGSGFDNGTAIDVSKSHAEKLVFTTSFHHMNDGGYDGWTDHTVTVTPSFQGINIRISGRNRNDIKDAIHEAFDVALKTDVTYDLYLPHYPQFAITSKWEDTSGNPSQFNQSWFIGDPATSSRYMSYSFAREDAAKFMLEASRKR
jgi:hypothetical protein